MSSRAKASGLATKKRLFGERSEKTRLQKWRCCGRVLPWSFGNERALVMDDLGFCSVSEAAVALHCSEQHVRTLLRQGRLSGHKVGHSWVVPQCSIDDFIEKPDRQPALATDRARRDRLSGELLGLSFFSGALGLDLGLEQAGITTVLAAEIDPAARATIVAN